MIYENECAFCGKKIDLEEGDFRIDTKSGKYFCSEKCLEEYSDCDEIVEEFDDETL